MVVFNVLQKYIRRNPDYVTERKNILKNAKNFYDGGEMIINAFNDKTFPLSPEEVLSEYVCIDEDEDEKTTPRDMPDLRISESSEERTPRDMSDILYRIITENDKIINKKSFKKYFGYNSLGDMQKELSTTKATPANETVADLIKDDLDKFKKEAFKTALSKNTTEYPHKTLYVFC